MLGKITVLSVEDDVVSVELPQDVIPSMMSEDNKIVEQIIKVLRKFILSK